jgi:AmmeMemoRadiSam system protein B
MGHMRQRSAEISTRPTAVAGMFYPDAPERLRQEVARYLAEVRTVVAAHGRAPKAIVVPHAGFMYSGPIAAAAYGRLRSAAATIHRVVLIGPSHRVAFRGVAVPGTAAFASPLGSVMIDDAARREVCGHPAVVTSDRAHEAEHSLEVQLPFLQSVLDDFTLLPLVAGDAPAEEVAGILDRVWDGVETLIVVSTDLSHYHGYDEARALDAATSRRIVAMEGGLDGANACGCVGLNGFLLTARRRGLLPSELDIRNSGDTSGDRGRVVGYGAFAFYEPDRPNA